MNIGEFRSRIRVLLLTQTKDEFGGVTTDENTLLGEFWAKVESRGSSANYTHNQQLMTYDYTITIRYQAEAPIAIGYVVTYGAKRLKINSIETKDEGNKKFTVLRCSNIGK